jgi:hypothetical protein
LIQQIAGSPDVVWRAGASPNQPARLDRFSIFAKRASLLKIGLIGANPSEEL